MSTSIGCMQRKRYLLQSSVWNVMNVIHRVFPMDFFFFLWILSGIHHQFSFCWLATNLFPAYFLSFSHSRVPNRMMTCTAHDSHSYKMACNRMNAKTIKNAYVVFFSSLLKLPRWNYCFSVVCFFFLKLNYFTQIVYGALATFTRSQKKNTLCNDTNRAFVVHSISDGLNLDRSYAPTNL